MNPTQQLLDSFEGNLNALIERYEDLLKEREQLFDTINRQRLEIIQTHADLAELQKEHRKLQTAYALTADSENRRLAKRRITNLISLIDKTIDNLAM